MLGKFSKILGKRTFCKKTNFVENCRIRWQCFVDVIFPSYSTKRSNFANYNLKFKVKYFVFINKSLKLLL